MPDKYNFDYLPDSRYGDRYQCIEEGCGLVGRPFQLPEDKREEHFLSHLKDIVFEPLIRAATCQNEQCGMDFEFEAPRKRGGDKRPPKYCPACTPIMAVEAPVTAPKATEDNIKEFARLDNKNELIPVSPFLEDNLESAAGYRIDENNMRIQPCENCGNEFSQERKRGKPYKFCEDCRVK